MFATANSETEMGATRNWLFLLLTVGSCVDAAMFCAHDGGQLQAAMSVAANNNQDDDVRITTGTKTFAVPIGFPHLFGYQIETTAEEDNDLVVSGGWNSNCSTMSPGAQHTVLDGQNQEADILVVSRHSAYFVDPKGSYTIRNLTVANAGGGENAIRSLISTTSNTAELVLDHVQVRGGTSTVYLYGGRIDVSHLLATGVTGGSDIVELAPSRAGSRIVYSSVYDNLLGPFSNDYCPLRLTGVKVIANNVAFGHQTTDGDVVRDACLYADNIEGSPQTDNNHFRAANINFLYTVDLHNQSYGVPDVETVTARSVAVVLGLVRAFDLARRGSRPALGQLGQLHADLFQVQTRDFLVELLRQDVDLRSSYVSLFAHRSICASVWLVNEFDITKLGWPVAQPRFTRRPSASMEDAVAVGEGVLVDLGLDVESLARPWVLSLSTWISLSKWPMLQTMAWSFIFSCARAVMTSLLPVVVT
jgi:hypothetical protein